MEEDGGGGGGGGVAEESVGWEREGGGGSCSHDLANLFCFETRLTVPISLLILYAYGEREN